MCFFFGVAKINVFSWFSFIFTDFRYIYELNTIAKVTASFFVQNFINERIYFKSLFEKKAFEKSLPRDLVKEN